MTTAVDAADSSRHEDVERTEILIIGAGPAGSVAAAMLRQQGRKVLMLERQQFPRFSIGESLLPQSMEYIEAAGLLQDVVQAGFQYKNGAAFVRGEASTEFDFRDKFSPGWGTTYQVQRADFDNVLARGAERMGTTLRFGDEVLSVQPGRPARVQVRRPDGSEYTIEAGFILDASGFARLLPRLLNLESPSNFPVRGAIFCHVRDHIPADAGFDRNKILITTHPEHVDVWYWTIPFSNGCCSLGVVAEPSFFEKYPGSDEDKLRAIVGEDPNLTRLLARAIAAPAQERAVNQVIRDAEQPMQQLLDAMTTLLRLYDKSSENEERIVIGMLESEIPFLDPTRDRLLAALAKSAQQNKQAEYRLIGQRQTLARKNLAAIEQSHRALLDQIPPN
jgi:flavin-dependent dehydrogenase